MNPLLTIIAALALLAVFATSAFAQSSNCAPREAVLERLNNSYGETRQGMGIRSDGSLFEIFASDETGTWTIVMTTPRGIACFMAVGDSFERVTEALITDEPT